MPSHPMHGSQPLNANQQPPTTNQPQATGSNCLPEGGLGAVPEQMGRKLSAQGGSVALGAKVDKVGAFPTQVFPLPCGIFSGWHTTL